MERVDDPHRGTSADATDPRRVPDPRDAIAIQNLVQAYAVHADRGAVAELAALFVDDAVWDGEAMGFGRAEGPGDIARLVTAHVRPDEPMMHLPGPAALSARSADEVQSQCWCLATRWLGTTTMPFIHFHYSDVVVRGDDGRWRFRSRRLTPAFPVTPTA